MFGTLPCAATTCGIRSADGFRLPSYHVSLTAGSLTPGRTFESRALYVITTIDFIGKATSEVSSTNLSSAFSTVVSSSPRNGRFIVWHAMSPNAPQPKSKKPRQLNGWYTFAQRFHGSYPFAPGAYAPLNGRSAAVASHVFQLKPAGILSAAPFVAAAAPAPCGHTGRFVHTCTSVTSPRMPELRTSTPRRKPGIELPWLPICVTTPYSFAVLLK